jgi:HAD superfamily hydrolase (TIGR01509 family)
MPIKILFCDWNGTILDDMPIWYAAKCQQFFEYGKTPPTINEYFCALESGDYMEVYRKFGISASREDMNASYESAYEKSLSLAELFPGTKKALMRLNAQGVRLVLVTAQLEKLVLPLLDKFGIRELFWRVATDITDKAAVFTSVMKETGADREDCFSVGDAPSDIRHARKAGIVSIALVSGWMDEKLLTSAEADHYIYGLDEIPAILSYY